MSEFIGALTYHHARPLEAVVRGEVFQKFLPPEEDLETDGMHSMTFSWLARKVGFYPLFMAAGRQLDDVYMTDYSDQWKRLIVGSKNKAEREYRRAGEFPNRVLFSFDAPPPDPVFTDFEYWCLVETILANNRDMPRNIVRSLFRPSWNRNDWISYANREPGNVQMVVPSLDLSLAQRVWVRNQDTKKIVEAMGFKGVEVQRLPVDRYAR